MRVVEVDEESHRMRVKQFMHFLAAMLTRFGQLFETLFCLLLENFTLSSYKITLHSVIDFDLVG
jgi:hypothetical protein